MLQFGYMLNPRCMERVVRHTAIDEYLELNRMWLSDLAPVNSESQALGCAIKYIRRVCPRVKWIQFFADERCGGCGIVYQASSFLYLGFHLSRFFKLDGEWYHELAKTRQKKPGKRGAYLQAAALSPVSGDLVIPLAVEPKETAQVKAEIKEASGLVDACPWICRARLSKLARPCKRSKQK